MRRKHIWLLFVLFAVSGLCAETLAQDGNSYRFRGGHYNGFELMGEDTVISVMVNPLYVYASAKNQRQYERLVRNVKKVYPYAMEARHYFNVLETQLDSIKSPFQREKFVADMEREIVRKYTPILEKMTYTQGKILIKLIDRETKRTPYQLLRDFRGRLTAGFYNAIAKIFSADLKQHYDPSKGGEDAQIEQIVTLIEAGLL